MKIYRRSDGFEVNDMQNRPLSWVQEVYGGDFVEIPRTEESEETRQRNQEIAQHKAFLAQTDYKILKKLEKLLPADDADVIERQNKRDRINQLEVL
jgi:hypothetical protein